MADFLDGEINGPELFVGLVGAAGSNMDEVAVKIKGILSTFNYDTTVIKLSKLLNSIKRYKKLGDLDSTSQFVRVNNFMDAGDDLRLKVKRGDALAILSVAEIMSIRKQQKTPLFRHAYIFNSLKQPAEINTLRKIYGEAFLLVSIFSPLHLRIQFLKEKIRRSENIPLDENHQKKAKFLVEKDSLSGHKEFGQNVTDAFPLGDVFIDISKSNYTAEIERVFNIWFGTKLHTPRRDEAGMYFAKTASLRSSDLSRQVGAAVTSSDGEVIVTGCNEVPTPKGGTIWEEDDFKDRDFEHGYDHNTKMKFLILEEVFERLKEHNWLSANVSSKANKDLVKAVLSGDLKASFENARITRLIEFGRIIHAEMAAIVGAARKGLPLKSSTLYCTTFPCHMCARHIIASGIERVVYIEPYPKGLAKQLYKKSIKIDADDSDPCLEAVVFESFVGISPTKYQKFFQMAKRKNEDGDFLISEQGKAYPKIPSTHLAYFDAEDLISKHILDNATLYGKECNEVDVWSNREDYDYGQY